jgi:tol-pal system protein YbgF
MRRGSRTAVARGTLPAIGAVGLGVGFVLALASASTGCDRDTEAKNLADMTNEIDHLQVERDESIDQELGTEAADSRPANAGVPPRLPAPAVPSPPVVRVGDDGAQGDIDSPDTEDPAPRPTIRVIGAGHRGDVQSVTDDPTSAPADTGRRYPDGALDPQAKRDYDAALALVTAKKYDQALDALAAFLVRYPDHPYADNALFWRGECYYARGDYLRAAEQFEGVVTRFPAGNKAPDALLKLGMSRQRLGDPIKAKECFDRLAQSYPQSDAAHHIPPVTAPATTPRGPASEDRR